MSVKKRLERLEAREELKELRAKYCYAVDTRNWDRFGELFTDDPVLDFGGMGTYEGQEGLAAFADEFVEGQLEGSVHMLSNPVLRIDGETATGRWYVQSPLTFADGTGGWRQGTYEDEYRKVGSDWHIDRIHLRFNYTADFEDGQWTDLRTV